ncbi:MAG: peptidylprolyl isomerase [Rhodospirillaceae bacterium]|jgi:peptidylprolyl isomerase|nr:peptidylprolyl isomerase [Rhodospirillaceae bacterium]MBT5241282.1 peptidylprolyl isomerase [Rhodospirillaceae bacterium]MBT5565083.1 peptidylprolyl isomerase [Rhodospirillaceae bacterium]MBT6088105.1 peptidylprolyl isomerase [Rhodospirillaceae bacterium]MBT6961926.1 peptidylprolyl isomerase [Rhodospirillaceae bacterium]
MSTAKDGDSVTFHYTGTLSDGTQFDSSIGSDPMGATLGEGRLIPGFEAALVGMAIGESQTFTVPADEAYGERNQDMVQTLELESFPDGGASIEIGQTYEMTTHTGQPLPMTVMAIEENEVIVDANHPLAGQDLTFDLELVGIE